jgi:hypothetical protein
MNDCKHVGSHVADLRAVDQLAVQGILIRQVGPNVAYLHPLR